MNKRKGLFRIGIVLSVLWLIAAVVLNISSDFYGWDYSFQIDDFFLYGITPIVIFWGIVWIVSGFKDKDTDNT